MSSKLDVLRARMVRAKRRLYRKGLMVIGRRMESKWWAWACVQPMLWDHLTFLEEE